MVSKFYNETNGPKGQENKIYTIVKGTSTGRRYMNWKLCLWNSMPPTMCLSIKMIFFDFSLTVKVAPHECVIRTGQP